MEELKKQFEIEWCKLPFHIADDNSSRDRIFNWFANISNRLEKLVSLGDSQPMQKPEIIILDWMDGRRTKYDNLETAKKEFEADKEWSIKNNAEFDKMLIIKIDEFNNID